MIVVFALLSSLAFGAGVALESRAAIEIPTEYAARPSLLLRLVRRPMWLIGLVANIGGFALQAAALSRGSLVVVQPLLTTSLLFTLLIIAVLTRNPIPKAHWAAILLVVTGLAIFLAVAAPPQDRSASADTEGWLLCVAVIVVIVVVAVGAGLRASSTARVALFAVAAGTADAFMATLAKAFSHALGHGFWSVFETWTPYAVAAGGIASLLLVSTAYQAGHPTVSLPIITVLDPVVAVLIGISLFGEQLKLGGVRAPAVLLGLAGTVTGLLMLTRDDELAEEIVGETPPRSPDPTTSSS